MSDIGKRGWIRIRTFCAAVICAVCVCGGTAWAQTESDLYNQALGYHQSKSWNQAIGAFESFIQKYPKSQYRSAAELYLGHSYLSRGDFVNVQDGATGRGHLEYIIAQGPKASLYREASLQNAFSYFSLMMYDQALPALEKFVAEFPDSEDLQFAYYYLGVTYSNLGRYSDALNTLSTCVSKFPNGALKDQCQLEKAIALGRNGQYAQADSELQRLALNPNYTFRDKASLQRAALLIVQEKYADASRILDAFLRESNLDDALYIEANQYQAYCYMNQGEYDRALACIDAIQGRGTTSPETAFLKIRIYTRMGRFDDALALLEQVRRSEYSLYGSDAINYYHATILLAQGKWDDAISLLVSFLNIAQDPSNASQVVFNYFNTTSASQNKLRPRDYLEACGTLVLSFVSRFATSHYAADNTNQQAVFNAMYTYANSQPDPYLMMIVTRIDTERQKAFTSPIGANVPQGTSTGSSGSLVIRPDQSQGTSGQGTSGWGGQGTPGQGTSDWGGQGTQGQGTSGWGGPGTSGQGAPGQGTPGQGTPQWGPTYAGGSDSGAAGQTASTGRMTEVEANTIYNNAANLYKSGRYEQASETLLKLLTTSETFWEDCPNVAASAALLRANTLFKLKRYDDAQTTCKTLVKLAPYSAQAADANYYLGFQADYYGQSDEAIAYFQKVVSSPYEGKFRDRAYYGLGWNEWERRNTIQAEKYFRKIYRDYTDSSYWGHAAWAAAMIEFQDQDYPAAERIVNDALSQHPDTSIVDRLLFLKGEIALKSKDYSKARVAFNTITTRYPDSSLEKDARGLLESLPKADSVAPDRF